MGEIPKNLTIVGGFSSKSYVELVSRPVTNGVEKGPYRFEGWGEAPKGQGLGVLAIAIFLHEAIEKAICEPDTRFVMNAKDYEAVYRPGESKTPTIDGLLQGSITV